MCILIWEKLLTRLARGGSSSSRSRCFGDNRTVTPTTPTTCRGLLDGTRWRHGAPPPRHRSQGESQGCPTCTSCAHTSRQDVLLCCVGCRRDSNHRAISKRKSPPLKWQQKCIAPLIMPHPIYILLYVSQSGSGNTQRVVIIAGI